ncbi:MAG: ATP-binding protein [Ferruginibacter sp.]
MKIFLFLIILFFSTILNAQLPDTIQVVNKKVYLADTKIQLHDLKNYTTILVDSLNKLTIGDIVSKNFDQRFLPVADSMVAQPYITYWLKLSIFTTGNIQNWWLLNENGRHGYVDVWYLNDINHVIEQQRTGFLVPHSQKTIKENSRLNRVNFSAKKGEIKNVYLKIYNEFEPAEISALQLRDPIIGYQREINYMMTAIGAAIFVISVLSFFFFFFMKEKAYLFFGIYTLLVSLHYLILHPEQPFINWFIPENPQLALPLFFLFSIGGWITFVIFGRYFINLPLLSRKIDKILIWVSSIWILSLVTLFIIMAVMHKSVFWEINFIFLLLFIFFLIRISFFKSVLVRFYVAGALWLVLFIILGIFNVNTPFLNPFPTGQLGQILIYVAGLAYKMRLNENEKVEAQVVKLRNVELAGLYEESKKQKEEIEIQKTNAVEALFELKSTQSQLIQSEKMASLGELTAGIAHEIQNPLNFVNNFSEVNKELIGEMREEITKGNYEEVNALAKDVEDNEQKINYHGKRADAIVKGMLQHSRSSSGQKEPTDINALADEYLRLAYHGLRAKDKSFNAALKTGYDETIGNINIIPQDIGRVILNLITNAFYAVGERKQEQSTGYEPTVSVFTKKDGDKVLISVKDNGNGIPQNVIEKIFQPFFTTKPTGQGTGLGLSMSYDIVKAHGGELNVETIHSEEPSTEVKGTTFTIILPAGTL